MGTENALAAIAYALIALVENIRTKDIFLTEEKQDKIVGG